ncbi:MAG: hypothetical protein WC529_08075 [Candidatus Margulisiibacteriota bacterium]
MGELAFKSTLPEGHHPWKAHDPYNFQGRAAATKEGYDGVNEFLHAPMRGEAENNQHEVFNEETGQTDVVTLNAGLSLLDDLENLSAAAHQESDLPSVGGGVDLNL